MFPDDLAPGTILAVDDEPNNLEIVREFLELDGHRVLTAEGGEAALEAVRGEKPDLVLLDVMMPGLDGFAVCRALKADPGTLFIPVVILSALRSTDDRVKGAEAGADEFLSKPFDHIELRTRVRSLLRVKRAHDRVQSHNAELEMKVTERTAELRRALSDLQQLDRLKSEFIANVSHELRTPLLHVKGYVDLLADGALGALKAEQATGLGVAREAIEQLERMVEDIVDFSQAQAHRLDLQPVSAVEVCRNVIEALEPLAARRRVRTELAAPPALPRVLADRIALTRALRHLLDNALKFSPPNGTARVSLEPRGAVVRITMEDNGPGIPPAELERIFQLFYQIDGSATRRAGGLGLGLALVKMLVEAHGSQVHVESALGTGSKFWFELAQAGG